MKRIVGTVALFSVLFVLNSCQSSKNSTASRMLKFNFEPGKSYDYDMITDFDQEIMGQTQEVSMTAQYGLDVTGQKDGVTEITTTFNALRMHLNVMGMTIEADTEKPLPADTSSQMNPLTIMNRMFHAIKGQQFHMKVGPEGKVIEVTGMEEMAQKLISSMGMGEEAEATLEQTFKQQFNDGKMKQQFEQAFFIFPGKEVKVGDSWVKEMPSPGGAGNFKTTYTVKEIEGDIVNLDVSSDFSESEEGGKMKGKQKGTMTVDARSGLIMESDLDLDIEVEEQGQTIDMKGKIRIRGRERK